ncbi:MAG: hypothetical protein JWM87_269 [Candidatus Eremiobacteraeota bacterium]|nr:hypothetical protein [Candidatus Eremiobacteraeota bacterium]
MQTLSPTAVRIARSLLPLAGVAAPLIALVRIVMWSVNVPYSDDWDWTGFSAAMRTGTLSWDQLWTPHNGHRELVVTLEFLAIDRLGGWNVVREELLSLACLVIGLIALYRLLRRTLEPLAADVAFVISAWLLAGPIAFESVLIGSNLGWPLGAAAMLVTADRLCAPDRSWRDVALAATGAVIASFTLAPGLLVWPCGLVILLGRRASWRTVASWCAAWACTLAAFFSGYPGNAAAAVGRAHSAGDAFHYALVFLGTPLRSAEMTLQILEAIGAMVTIAFVIGTVAAQRCPDERERAWPFIALGAYALLGAAVTSFTRAGLGEGQAMSPRYVSVSAFLLVAAVALLLPRALALRTAASRSAAAVAALVLLAVLARSEKLGSTLWRDYDWHRGVAVQGLAHDDRTTFRESYPDPVRLGQYLEILRSVDDGPLDYGGNKRH